MRDMRHYPNTDTHFDRVIGLHNKLKDMAESDEHPDWVDNTPEQVASFQLILGDDVTTSYGGAYVDVVPNDDSVMSTTFNFRVDLGPVNAEKLIAFLKTLPPEPHADEEQKP